MAPNLIRAATLALRATASICPASPVCPQDDQCSLTANGVSLQVSCGTDFYGGDLQLARTSTLAGCMKACSVTEGCVAASYLGQDCYLKNTLMAARENANVIGVAITAREASTPSTPSTPEVQQTCPTNFACPENNGCTYTDGLRTVKLTCGVDYYGGDLDNQWSETLQDCAGACAANEQCVAASFVGGRGSGRCYLKSTKNGANINENVDAFHVVAASSTPSTPSTTTTTPTIPDTVIPASCQEFSNGVNLVSNPSIENMVFGTSAETWEIPSSIYTYPILYEEAAHCGTSLMVLYVRGETDSTYMSQKISTALDTTKPYAASFFVHVNELLLDTVCSLELFANDLRISTIDMTKIDVVRENVYPYKGYASDVFTPKSSEVTLKFIYRCTASAPSSLSSMILIDDISLSAL